MRRFFSVFSIIIAVSGSSNSSAADYWPMTDGTVYHYENKRGFELTVSYTGNSRHWTYPGSTQSNSEEFTVDGSGNVILSSFSTMTSGAVDPDHWTFNPGVRFLDFPLFVGKTWSTATTALGHSPENLEFIYTVESEEPATVPMGTYQVFVVSEIEVMGLVREQTYYLDQEIGPVILPGVTFL